MSRTQHKTARASSQLILFTLAVISLLLAAHLIVVGCALFAPDAGLGKWLQKFDLDQEHNLPTYINSMFFLIGAFWCARLSAQAKWAGHRLGWAAFTLLFTYLGLDEALIIHEQLAAPLRQGLGIHADSPFFHAWVIPGMLLAGVIGIGVVLVRRYHKRLVLFADTAMHVFLLAAGVIALEVAGTYFYDNAALYRLVVVPLEEIFELGMAAALWVKLRHRFYARKH